MFPDIVYRIQKLFYLPKITKLTSEKYGAVLACVFGSLFASVAVLFLKLSQSSGSESSFLVGVCGTLYCLSAVCRNYEKSRKSENESAILDREKTSFNETSLIDTCEPENERNVAKVENSKFGITWKTVVLILTLGPFFSGGYTHFYFVAFQYTSMGDTNAACLTVHFIRNRFLILLFQKKLLGK